MIRVCDAFMGAGKTSAAINYMRSHPDRRYIYVTPYYDETERVRENCPDLHFVLPSNRLEQYGFAKKQHFKELIQSGVNIAVTHELFKRTDREMTELIESMGYCMFIDEAVDVFKRVDVSQDDLRLVIDSGWLTCEVNERGETEYFYDEKKTGNKYESGRLMDLFIYAASQRLFNIPNVGSDTPNLWYWTFDPQIFRGGIDIFILTFMFDGSIMQGFFHANNIEYSYIGVSRGPMCACDGSPVFQFQETPQCPPDYVGELSKLIKIIDDKKMNAIGEGTYALSYTWFNKRLSSDPKDELSVVKNNIINFFYHKTKGKGKTRLWSTFKAATPKLKGKGYTKAFLSFSVKATNAYRECTELAYAVNIFCDPNIRLSMNNHGAEINDEAYALSTMVQWIWRSAIRDGKSITVYVPSKRMRELLINWIDSSEKKYFEMKNLRVANGGM